MTLQRPILAANWKMHKSPSEAEHFFADFLGRYPERQDRTVVFFPPAVSLAAARAILNNRSDIRLGVQNIHWEASGAYTGEISAPMARAAGADFVLVGHSERRHTFGETIDETARKTRAALDSGLVPVLCVGETLAQRRGNQAESTVAEQLEGALSGLSAEQIGRVLIAYEPVWAIGTGETASPADATDMHRAVRADLAARVGASEAEEIRILYGGSVKPNNSEELLAADQVDGTLVGGASLDPKDFAAICGALH